MQLRLRAVGGEVRDLVVTLPDRARVADLARVLGGVDLFDANGLLDPDASLLGGPICDGDEIGVGTPLGPAPSPTPWELHTASGHDAGQVLRLVPGEHVVGDLRLVVTADQVCVTGPGRFTADPGEPATPIEPESVWPVDTSLATGDRLLVLRRPVTTARPPGPSVPSHRPPRLTPAEPITRFRLPSPPSVSDRPTWPWLMVLLPVMIGVIAFLITHAWQMLLFLALSPLLALGGAASGRRLHRRRTRRERATYDEETAAVSDAARVASRRDAALRRERAPDPGLLLTIADGSPRLWERRPGDADFLRLRIGTAEQPSAVCLVDPALSDHSTGADEVRWPTPDVPVVVDLCHGSVGIVGPDDVRRALADALVGQAAALHAPGDLAIDAPRSWADWLAHRGVDAPHRLVVREGGAPVPERGGIALADRVDALPSGCGSVVVAQPDGSVTLRRDGADDLPGIRPDLVVDGWADRLVRVLARVRPPASAGGGLPDRCALVDVAGPIEPGRSTRAVLGAGPGGAPYVVDLARDGPHAVIAGTTGAGKSELLRSLVLSLAMANTPDALGFVLVDYKGGAAFRACERLPHVTGVVTDLDPALTRRALTSLRAELRRRERVLADHDASDLAELERHGSTALGRLVLVVDEFATLSTELPDFVSGLVDIARRGRSLGVHLVLATQRPSGVITPEIRANTALRIALRVTDPDDSSDVVGVPDAARIPEHPPGRAVAVRAGGVAEPFQTASAGLAAAAAAPAVRDLHTPARASGEAVGDGGDGNDGVERLVDRIAGPAAAQPRPAPPWLPPLPTVIEVTDLPGCERGVGFGIVDRPADQSRGTVAFDPAAARHLAIVGAARSGRTQAVRTIAAGLARSGDPTEVQLHVIDCGGGALAPLGAATHTGVVATRTQQVRLERLTARLGDLVRDRQRVLAEGRFAGVAEQRHAVRPDQQLPWIVLLVDRWDALVQAYDTVDGGRLVDALYDVLRDGPGVGITAVVTGDRTLLHGRSRTLVDDVVLLRAADPGDYAAVGVRAAEVPADLPPGAGFSGSGERIQIALLAPDPGGVAQDAALTAALTSTGAAADLPPDRLPFRLDDLPTQIDRQAALALPAGPGLLVAVGGDRLGRRTLDPRADGGFLVVGPRRSGRSTTLLTVAVSAVEAARPVRAITPRGGPLVDVPRPGGPVEPGTVLLVDDLEALDTDSVEAALVTAYVDRCRDGPGLVVAAGSAADLGALYRGPAVPLRRNGDGLLLAPRSPADADLLGASLTRSAYGERWPPGGGYLVRAGTVERVQVVAADAESIGRRFGRPLGRPLSPR